ncbi:uncharacterized protein (TIGR00156 family) [Acinetobacter calcoaceticus]|uniref:Uncharacterized protein (TIGR00156 family) n=1 Tax=Acinetobacter calcoaceticus TaxID=471 RepID=A0A4R1XXA2_ACICA|nr:uncharacterized protein (TIGR00156 family) [Acinetobacter calcoaceticus]
MKNKIFLVPLILLSISTTTLIWASDDHRIIQAGQNNPVSILAASKLADETAITVTGTIVRMVKNEFYEIKDSTGSIFVDIDDDLANPAQLKPGTKVKIIAEVDTHRYKPTDLDAVKIEILP